MSQQYRYISARTLLGLTKLDRCQSLPLETWTPVEKLWHLVFISHRWGSQNDPDPSGAQLMALKQLVRRMVDVTGAIQDERTGIEAARERVALIPSLIRQGTLQAGHLIFRSLCYCKEFAIGEVDRVAGDGILDVIGFWYDYSCLPQDPKTIAEAREFAQTLQGIGDMILSPHVSTLVLRKKEDGYLSRGWCVVESLLATAKDDVCKPMVLRTDRWNQPISVLDSAPFLTFKPDVERAIAQWEDPSGAMSAWDAFEVAINATALPLLLKSERSTSDFALTLDDTIGIGQTILAEIQPHLALLQENGHLDLSVPLAPLLRNQGLGCRDDRDYILVSLLLLRSLMSQDATGDVAIWHDALVRFTEGLPLHLTRCNGVLKWRER